jgi:hypothetical protein
LYWASSSSISIPWLVFIILCHYHNKQKYSSTALVLFIFCCKTTKFNKELICTEPTQSMSIPCFMYIIIFPRLQRKNVKKLSQKNKYIHLKPYFLQIDISIRSSVVLSLFLSNQYSLISLYYSMSKSTTKKSL